MKKISLFLYFILSLSSLLNGQKSSIDSLVQVLKGSKEDTNKVKLLNKITAIYIQIPPNYTKALKFAEDSRAIAEKLSFKKGAAVACEHLGTIYGYFGVYEKSFDNYLEALKSWEILKDSGMIIHSYQNLAFAYSLQENFKKALEIHLILKKIIEKRGNMEEFPNMLWGLSGIYKNYCKQIVKQGDSIAANYNYEKAVEYAQSALRISENRKDSQGMASFYNTLGLLYDQCNLCEDYALVKGTTLLRGNYYQQAETYYFKAYEIHKRLGLEEGILDDYTYLGLFYRNQGNLLTEIKKQSEANTNYQRSLDYYLKALSIIEKLGYPHGIANYNKEAGIAYLKTGKMQDAQKHILTAATGFEKIRFKDGAKDCYEKLSVTSIKRGDYKNAYEYYKKYSVFKDSLLNEETVKHLTEMSVKYESDKKDAALLAKETIIQKEKENRNLAIIIGCIVVASVSFIGFVLFKRKQTKHSLLTEELENKALRSQLNPHFIFNALNSIQNYIHEHPGTAEDYLSTFSGLMREVLENSEKEYIYLEDEISMVKKYLELESIRVKNGFDYEIKIDSSVEQETTKLPPLILQPIVENAIWHGIAGRSEKGEIYIHIYQEDSILWCVIENHCGGDPRVIELHQPNKRKSFGLKIIKERLELLSKGKRRKGYLNMQPLQDGMKVTLAIPV